MDNIFTVINEKSKQLDDIQEKLTQLVSEKKGRGPLQTPEIVSSYVELAKEKRLTSALCKEIDFKMSWYLHWCEELKQTPRLHRKQWEFVYILQALFERDLLKKGKKALGFAVGTEPLPAIFAKYGIDVVATDLDIESGTEKGWTNGEQLCTGIESFEKHGIVDLQTLKKFVTVRSVNMNEIPDDLRDFDFTWSACSFEHLGSIEKGLAFVENQMKTLKPGGWAIHSSEYNISSNTDTIENDNLSLFRQRDYLDVAKRLRDQGHFVEELDFSLGWMPTDYFVDVPPYSEDAHLRLQLEKYVSSSFCLIIQKKA